MFRFLSALFSAGEEQARHGPDSDLVDKAIDRLVQGTDQRLQALGDYRKRLRAPVEQTVMHVISLVDALPAPVAIGPGAYGEDPRLRAFFASPEHVSEVLGTFRVVREYLAKSKGAAPEQVFGLLSMAREERTVFGMELDGDRIRRDVIQVAVNFSGHRFLAPSADERESRRELKIRAFDFLVERALENLMNERGKRRELDRQRHLLRQKLNAMRSGQWGLAPMLDEHEGAAPDLAGLEAEIARIDAEFGQCRTDRLGLEESLDCIVDVVSTPADWLSARTVSLRLDARGIKVAEPAASAIEVMELFSRTGAARIMLFGNIAPADLPPAPDFWKGAARYL